MCIRSNCVDPFLIVGVSLHLVTSYCILVHQWVSGYICQHLAASDSILQYPGASCWILLNPTASSYICQHLAASDSILQYLEVSCWILVNPTASISVCLHLPASDNILQYPEASCWILLNPTASGYICQHQTASCSILLNPIASYCICKHLVTSASIIQGARGGEGKGGKLHFNLFIIQRNLPSFLGTVSMHGIHTWPPPSRSSSVQPDCPFSFTIKTKMDQNL